MEDICQMRQTWILIIIFILFMISHHNHVCSVGIDDTDALVLQEKLSFPLCLVESKFICQMRQTWTLIIIFILFVIGHYDHVLLIGIHGIGALDWQEKLLFSLFSF